MTHPAARCHGRDVRVKLGNSVHLIRKTEPGKWIVVGAEQHGWRAGADAAERMLRRLVAAGQLRGPAVSIKPPARVVTCDRCHARAPVVGVRRQLLCGDCAAKEES